MLKAWLPQAQLRGMEPELSKQLCVVSTGGVCVGPGRGGAIFAAASQPARLCRCNVCGVLLGCTVDVSVAAGQGPGEHAACARRAQ